MGRRKVTSCGDTVDASSRLDAVLGGLLRQGSRRLYDDETCMQQRVHLVLAGRRIRWSTKTKANIAGPKKDDMEVRD